MLPRNEMKMGKLVARRLTRENRVCHVALKLDKRTYIGGAPLAQQKRVCEVAWKSDKPT